jgi:hypothetical protein
MLSISWGLSCPTVCIALAVHVVCTLSVEQTSDEDYVSGSGRVKSVTAGVCGTHPCTERKSGAPAMLLMPARPKGWATRQECECPSFHGAISPLEIGKIGESLGKAGLRSLVSAFIALEAAGNHRRCNLWCDAIACQRFVSQRCIVSTFLLLRLYSAFVVLFHAVPPVVLSTTYEHAQILEDFDSVTRIL